MNKENKSKLELISEIALANNKNLELIEEINELQRRIDKTVQAIDELLIYSDFNDITNGFGNVKEELKFYLSDCKTLEEFRKR